MMTAALSPQALERTQRAWRDGSSLRVVGRATLRVDHADQAWAARQALEDGLNTADFADCGRLIVVRQLQLRQPAAGAGGPAFARALEAAWRALAPSALAFDHPAAESAPAVYFRSAMAARLAWLQRVAALQPVGAWFWRSALPELTASASADGATQAVLATLVRDSPNALGQALMTWPALYVRCLVAALPTPMARAPWSAEALRQAMADATSPVKRDALPPVSELVAPTFSKPSEQARIVAWLATLDVDDAPTLAWLATLAWTSTEPAAITIAEVAAIVAETLSRIAQGRGDERSPEVAVAPSPAPSAELPSPVTHWPAPRPTTTTDDAAGKEVRSTPMPITALLPSTRVRAADRSANTRWPWLASSVPTAHGGLLLLLNVLRQLDFDAWLALQPAAQRQPLVALLFATLADRLQMPPDDPQRALFVAAGSLAGDHAVAQAIALWLRCMRRVLRLQARIGPASLVRRDAGVAITATHVDLVMPLQAVDLRLRRAGLDSDPGWLPWFGWIVKLHFVAGEHGA